MRTKMADGVYEEERRKTVEDSKMVNETVEMLDIMHKECVNNNGLCSLNSKFYLTSDSGNFGTNFSLNGVGLRVHASEDCDEHVSEFSSDFKSLCPSGVDNGRKKRCTDRYDSSESSDSGVATLSSTDCSTSSGTSDITEPGSPYSSPSSAALRSPSSSTASTSSSAASGSASSSASEESDDSRTGSPAIPQALRHPSSPQPSTPPEPRSPEAPSTPPPAPEDDEARPPDPWPPSLWSDDRGRAVFGTSQKRRFHAGGAFKSVVPTKRSKTSPSSTYQGHFQNLIQCFQGKSTSTTALTREEERDEVPGLSAAGAGRCTESQGPAQPPMARGQGKITEYFKTQMKPPSSSKCGARKDGRFGGGRIGSLAAVEVSGGKVVESGLVDKYFSFSAVESRGEDGVMVAVSSSSFVPVAPERLESSEVKGLCANGRVGGVVRGPDAEAVASGDEPVASVAAVESETVVTNMPAPILSAPRTIRFPVVQRSSGGGKAGGVISNGTAEPRTSATCQWSECKMTFDCGGKLMEHLQIKHVNSQVEASENFVCLWVGCKVYARTSCSRSWLERHVLSHGGNKPFRCIFDGCGQRFSSQTMLERHVNGHFNVSSSGSGSMGNGPGGSAGAKRSLDATPNKAFRRNGKKLRYRRRPWSARMFDYFDTGVMEELQHRLVAVAEKELSGQVTPRGDEVLLTSKVLARRTELDGKTKVLLRWFPEDIIPDEWVSESEVKPKCTFPIRTLPTSAHSSLRAALFGASAPKHRRKTKASGQRSALSTPSSLFSEAPSPSSSQSCSVSSSLS